MLPFLEKLKQIKLPKIPNPFSIFRSKQQQVVSSIAPTTSTDFTAPAAPTISTPLPPQPQPTIALPAVDISAIPEQYPGLNLFIKTGGNPLANIKYSRVLAILKVVILITLTLFILLFFVNQGLTLRLEQVKKETDRLYKDISVYDSAVEKTRNLSRRIQFYKTTLTARPSLAEKTRLIASVAGDQITIVKVRIENKTFYLNAKGSSALMFAKILETYRVSKKVGDIKLKSARLVKDRITKQNGFAIELEGVFK